MIALLDKMYFGVIAIILNLKASVKDEKGDTNIIAIVLILAIVVALAIIFRRQLSNLFSTIWGSIADKTDTVIN